MTDATIGGFINKCDYATIGDDVADDHDVEEFTFVSVVSDGSVADGA